MISVLNKNQLSGMVRKHCDQMQIFSNAGLPGIQYRRIMYNIYV